MSTVTQGWPKEKERNMKVGVCTKVKLEFPPPPKKEEKKERKESPGAYFFLG